MCTKGLLSVILAHIARIHETAGIVPRVLGIKCLSHGGLLVSLKEEEASETILLNKTVVTETGKDKGTVVERK